MLRIAFMLLLLALPGLGFGQDWGAFVNVSSSIGMNASRLCIAEASRGDLGCPTYAPSLTTAGDISVTRNLSAAKFIGDGSLLTGLTSSSPTVTTGLSGSIVYRDGTGLLVANGSFSISSTTGSIGIGAGAPASLSTNGLYASGNIQAGGNMFANAYYLTSGQGLVWGSAVSASIVGDSINKYIAITTSGTEAMRIVSTGYVGIGTASPFAPLNIRANTNRQIVVDRNSASTRKSSIGFAQQGTNHWEIGIDYNDANAQNFYMWDADATTFRMVFNSTGMGLSTVNPSTTLHVNGTIRMADGGEACDANRLGAMKYSGGAFSICRNTTTGWEALTAGSGAATDRIISGTTQAIAYGNTSLSLVTAGTERVVIGTNGGVGIGQQPASGVALAVSGTASITSDSTVSGTLTLSENPNATCSGANINAMKIVNGRIFLCRSTP